MNIVVKETWINPAEYVAPGGCRRAAIVRAGRRFCVAFLIVRYGGDGWRCDSRGNGFGVGNTAEAAARGAWYDAGGGPQLTTLREARETLEAAGLKAVHND